MHLEQNPTNTGLKVMRNCGAKLWNDIFIRLSDSWIQDTFKDMLLDSNFFEKNMISCIKSQKLSLSWYENIFIRRGLLKYKRNLIEHEYY